ncbi:histidine phosphatase superfamily (branch 2) domain-containing protein [Ditylenchus destructor]|uniref:Histidine phosphatase superfamily (Branch 2) domain-containing protein n=1 Tax=Ditylenchus destructor TaxID=166010 RepID=A0AAD4R630_9BILA|nr:histidine phosphatase superfamily (branch 2) domain-containing protein [Ditylenchus destructor]
MLRLGIISMLLLLDYGFCHTLQHVQVIFRHGERAPTTFITFPTDPPGIDSNFPYEHGEMTNNGIWQEFTLGSNLREEYGHLVDFTYRSSQVGEPNYELMVFNFQLRIYSGLDNRTITSAQAMLASFLPPTGNQVWNSALLWQPIPTIAQPIIDHVSFGVFDHCPAVRNSIANSDGYAAIFNSHIELVKELEVKTGLTIPNLYIFQMEYNVLKELLPLPKWAKSPEFMEEVINVQNDLHRRFIDLFLDSIGGWHFDQLLGRMDESVDCRTKHKMVFYSGHDTNIMTLGRFLNIDLISSSLLTYGSYLSIELHERDKTHFVEMHFHPHLNGSKIKLNITNCPDPCRYSEFRSLGGRLTSQQWVSTCLGITFDGKCTLFGSVAGGLMILVETSFGLTPCLDVAHAIALVSRCLEGVPPSLAISIPSPPKLLIPKPSCVECVLQIVFTYESI